MGIIRLSAGTTSGHAEQMAGWKYSEMLDESDGVLAAQETLPRGMGSVRCWRTWNTLKGTRAAIANRSSYH